MKYICGFLLSALSPSLMGDCGTGLSGTYILDMQHLRSQLIDAYPDYQQEDFEKYWDEEPFIKHVLPLDAGRGESHHFSMGSWHVVDSTYAFHETPDGKCMMSITLHDPDPNGIDSTEEYPIRQLSTGFCLHASTPNIPNFEDCYVHEPS